MRDALRIEGHEVSSASDGDEAIAKVSQRSFDVVLMDLEIPRRNGLEVIRALRGEGVRSKMVLMTGWDSETARADSRAELCDTVHSEAVQDSRAAPGSDLAVRARLTSATSLQGR